MQGAASARRRGMTAPPLQGARTWSLARLFPQSRLRAVRGQGTPRRFVVVGAGPAGLTAAYELARYGHAPIVLEKAARVGGLSGTETYRGFHFDMGGHRFFTKVEEIDRMWRDVLHEDFLTRQRLSRIYYRKRFFDYPLKPLNAVTGLGPLECVLVLLSYVRWRVLPYRSEDNFEQWVTNRFGRRLFRIFFKSYTEKVWGIPCTELSAEWAAQRIRGLSLLSAVTTMLFRPRHAIRTLIEQFDYPRLGPGMMWEAVARIVCERGGSLRLERSVQRILREGRRVKSVEVTDGKTVEAVEGTDFVSSMPLTELVKRLDPAPPPDVLAAAEALRYRDFLTVCLIVECEHLFPDNWIYVHDPTVRVGRIQNFKNWSPDMVPDPKRSSLGLEYFCNEGDELWNRSDEALVELGCREVSEIGLARAEDVIDGCVFRMPKAYPVYDAEHAGHVRTLRAYVDSLENLQTVGRNGLHRYNNQDHAMLTAICAVRNALLDEEHDLWAVNTDPEYHEEEHEPGRNDRAIEVA